MGSANSVLLVAFGLGACASSPPQTKPTITIENVYNEPVGSSPVASAPSRPSAPTHAQLQTCNSAAPFIVRAANQTRVRFDVCTGFEHALTSAMQTVTFGPPGIFEVNVTVKELKLKPAPNTAVSCKISIGLSATGQVLAQTNGSASVGTVPSGPLRYAIQDCIEAVIANLLTRLAPTMQAHVASTATPAAPAAQSGGTASGSGTSPTQTP